MAVKSMDAIAPLFAPGDVIELRALGLNGGVSCCGKLGDRGDRRAFPHFVETHNDFRNVYVGANPLRAELPATATAAMAEDVACRRNMVLDLDLKDAPITDPDWSRTVAALRVDAEPSLIVQTGNGFHVWFGIEPLSGADMAASAGLLADVMAVIGADNRADLPRIVRLPFTVNVCMRGWRG